MYREQFSDFTVESYSRILDRARTMYSFESFSNEECRKSGPHVIWRHDVDFSMHRALRLAQLEAERGCSSTFFLMLTSEFYNLHEADIRKIAKQIASNGHKIGLHFDPTVYDIKDYNQMVEMLRWEGGIVADIVGESVEAVSFHNPTQDLLQLTSHTLGGMVNAYSEFYRNRYKYCSDSNGYWRFDRLEDVLNSEENPYLHVLTHPVWWQEVPLSPRARVSRCAEGRANSNLVKYDGMLIRFGRKNIK
ncbi:hypothetical protein XMD530_000390 [Marinobacterium sp. xm-d-530]|nr:hypothetical protein [Marinobacterium sp. xm-d-530]